MRCERCQGSGIIKVEYLCPNLKFYLAHCDDCGGSGISYCCDDSGINPPNSFDLEKRNRMWGRYFTEQYSSWTTQDQDNEISMTEIYHKFT